MKKKLKKILLVFLIIIIATCAGFLIYASSYYHASDDALQYLTKSGEGVTVTQEHDLITFTPDHITCGMIFYPGGKVACQAYAPLLYRCAQKGILCIMPKMPLNLAVFGINRADGLQKAYPDVTDWYIAGHSLGGSMAVVYVKDHADDYRGLILLASYSTEDLKNSGLSVLSVYGAEDHVLNLNSYAKYRKNLPDALTEKIIPGGCHSYFGTYGIQRGDGTPSISNDDQQEYTAALIAEWINAVHPRTD